MDGNRTRFCWFDYKNRQGNSFAFLANDLLDCPHVRPEEEAESSQGELTGGSGFRCLARQVCGCGVSHGLGYVRLVFHQIQKSTARCRFGSGFVI